MVLGLSRGGRGVSIWGRTESALVDEEVVNCAGEGVMFVRGLICCKGRWSMECILVDVELACVRLARGARLGFRVLLENLMWCLDSISQSGIGWKPTLISAFRNKGLACSAAETLGEAFIAEKRDCLSVSEGV